MMFQPNHIELISKGIKIATRRRHKRPMEKIGGTYYARERMFQPKSEARVWYYVTEVYVQRLGDMTEEDAGKEGGYTLGQYKRAWEEINGISWDPDEEVHVYEFERAPPPADVPMNVPMNKVHPKDILGRGRF